MNTDFEFQRREEDDYYSILGCHDSATIEQILVEYKHRALLYHPDKSNDGLSKEKFQKLQEAKNILSNPETRRDYDQWKAGGLTIPYAQWKMVKGPGAPIFHWTTHKNGNMLQFGNHSQEKPPSQKDNYRFSRTASPHAIYSSILTKFRNYEI